MSIDKLLPEFYDEAFKDEAHKIFEKVCGNKLQNLHKLLNIDIEGLHYYEDVGYLFSLTTPVLFDNIIDAYSIEENFSYQKVIEVLNIFLTLVFNLEGLEEVFSNHYK